MQQLEVTKIRPSGSWIDLDLKEIARHRELLYFLTLRDIKIRYKQTLIGIAWALLQPVLTVAIFTVIFSRFAQFDTGRVPYPLVALSGLVIWLFVHNAVSMASISFVSNTNLVTKVYFPRLILPASASLAGLVDLAITTLILIGFMIFYRIEVTWNLLLAPIFLAAAVFLAVSLGTLFSALNVRFRDVKFALPFMLQVWMIASPVFYPTSILSEKWTLPFAINPLSGIIDGFRSALFGTAFDWRMISISFISLIMLSLISLFIFKWMEDDFADIV
jgi:lipopolysaccharide transport system permease protein